MPRLIPILAALFAASVAAQAPGTCVHGQAEKRLDVSDVRASVYNTGALFSRDGRPNYVVPAFGSASPLYLASLWVGGTVDDELRTAAATYDNFEFWPGPLNPDGSLPNPADCSGWDRIWRVSAADLATYGATGEATADLAEWPVELGAEVVDGDGVEGNYNLEGGDRPRLYGSQTAFWVMNDVGNQHQSTGTAPLGLEVRVHAFAVPAAEPALDRGTFYRYTLLNRSGQAVEDTRVGFFADFDLGGLLDDYVGSDPSRGLVFGYNADNDDEGAGSPGYGPNPPAAGLDLLGGVGNAMYTVNNGSALSDPQSGVEVWDVLHSRWRDGTPLYRGSDGYDDSQFDEATYPFPDRPEFAEFWSEVQAQPSGPFVNAPGDRRAIAVAPAFDFAPGEARTFDVALLFAQGEDHLNSVAALRAASDLVQARYADGSLFDPVEAPPPVVLPAPQLVGPPDGATFQNVRPTLEWTAVEEAEGYSVQLSPDATFGTFVSLYVEGTSVEAPSYPENEVTARFWRVAAVHPSGTLGEPSDARSFTYQLYRPAFVGNGAGIVEVASPFGPPCPDPGGYDEGCEEGYGGNTVWRDDNPVGDYYVTGGVGLAPPEGGTLGNVELYVGAASPDDFEIRFTGAEEYAVYFYGATTTRNQIAHVPFEVWNVRTTPDDPSDDVQMIPMLRSEASPPAAVTDWTNTFTGADRWAERLGTPLTESVFFVMPDRPDGYARFREAALAFGGAGVTYDPASDGDTQVDTSAATGGPCPNQGYFADFCYRNDLAGGTTVAPVARVSFGDADSSGTTPPAGTVVRFVTSDSLPVAGEDGPGGGDERPEAPAVAVQPNPARERFVVRYTVPEMGPARVTVYDVLGRAVRVLAEGMHGAGRHEGALEAASLAPGVYVVVVEAGAGRAARTVTVVR